MFRNKTLHDNEMKLFFLFYQKKGKIKKLSGVVLIDRKERYLKNR